MTALALTPEEILEALDHPSTDDLFGTQTADLLSGLPFEEAKRFLKDDVTADQWAEHHLDSVEAIRERAAEYLEFAVEKMQNERGLSAVRAQYHYRAWILLSFGWEKVREYDNTAEGPYGREKLRFSARAFGIEDKWKALTREDQAHD